MTLTMNELSTQKPRANSLILFVKFLLNFLSKGNFFQTSIRQEHIFTAYKIGAPTNVDYLLTTYRYLQLAATKGSIQTLLRYISHEIGQVF